ncbi:MAG: hypothetical protein ACE5FH_08730 [Candidatus Zixiibacteriota bacterium]
MTLHSRHWVFLGLFVLIGVAMALRYRPKVDVSPNTNAMHAYIDSLPKGSIIIVSFDHEASSLPEVRPIALALLRHAFSRGHKLVGVALLAEGTVIGYRLLQTVADEYDLEYGKDYAYLGFKPQYIAAILSMGESIRGTYPEDYAGRPYEQIEMLQNIGNYDDIAAVMSIADGSLTTHWIEYGGRYNLPVLAGVTAAMVTTYDPYLSSGQLKEMIGGLRGAAEYEKLIGQSGGGARAMLAQTMAHLYVIALVVLGNILYFRSRRTGMKQ